MSINDTHNHTMITMLIPHRYKYQAPWLHSNKFCKTCQHLFCPNWRCLCCMMAFAGAFTTKHPHCFVYLDEDSFDMLYKNYCWAAIPDPIWTTNVPYERKINMLSSTDNNFMICPFDFERFSIESRFSFFNSHCIYFQVKEIISCFHASFLFVIFVAVMIG